jgi:hypothetical protein
VTVRNAVAFLIAATVTHFLWELAACGLFYVEKLFPLTWGGMLWVTGGDVLLTGAIYIAVGAMTRDIAWGTRPLSAPRVAAAMIIGVVVATAVEMHALATNRWSYSELMPVVPIVGVGVLPLLQLAMLTPVSVWIAQAAARHAQRSVRRRDAPASPVVEQKPAMPDSNE